MNKWKNTDDTGVNRAVHEKILGLPCWHEIDRPQYGDSSNCRKCKQFVHFKMMHGEIVIDQNPNYCQDLNAVLPLWEKFGFSVQPSGLGSDGRVAWWRVGFTSFADRGDMPLTSPENPSVEGGTILPRTIAIKALQAAGIEPEEK